MRYILTPIYKDLGFDEKPSESHVDLMHRSLIIQQACFFGHAYCVNRAQHIYREWMANKNKNLYEHLFIILKKKNRRN